MDDETAVSIGDADGGTVETRRCCSKDSCKVCCKRTGMVCLGVVVVLLLVFAGFAATSEKAKDYAYYEALPSDRVWVIAHAGAHNLYPDNTMFAFVNSVDMGVDMLEMDVRLSADKQVVVIHDETTGHYTQVDEKVQDLTLAQLQALDAGYSFGSLGPQKTQFESAERNDPANTFPYRGLGIKIPALREVFERFPEMPKNIELKPLEMGQEDPFVQEELIDGLCDLIREYNQTEKVIVCSFVQEAVVTFRERCPEVTVSPSYPRIVGLYIASLLGMEVAVTPDYEIIQVPQSVSSLTVTTTRMINAARNRNVKTAAWTINDRQDMESLTEKGIDGILTDRPDILLNVQGRLADSKIVTDEEFRDTPTGKGCERNSTLLTEAGCIYLGF